MQHGTPTERHGNAMQHGTNPAPVTAYLAPDGLVADLEAELGADRRETFGRLVVTAASERSVAWCANVWRNPVPIPVASIGDAVKKLKAIQRNWAMYSFDHHRRAALIAEQLPKVSAKPLVFGTPPPTAPLGSWTLLESNLVLAAASCSSPFPNGEAAFVEDRENPPSRAYLKLWELFTRIGVQPAPGARCIDLGSSPGGWTWALAQLQTEVVSIDKAPLEPRVAALPGVSFRRESAFGLDPTSLGHFAWLFSDVVCYPKRLLQLVHNWIAAGTAERFVCTIKFQGETDFTTMQEFAAIPGSRLIHLHNNKHELTWIRLAPGELGAIL